MIANPGPVLAVALGDEVIWFPSAAQPCFDNRSSPQPLYDNDFGSPSELASYINQMKSAFESAGADIPVSISDMAYGWQSAGDISSVAAAVDFFMINNFPYFAADAQDGGSETSWNDFTKDITYFEGIADGKPLLVTQVCARVSHVLKRRDG